jgi:hypothetical protein
MLKLGTIDHDVRSQKNFEESSKVWTAFLRGPAGVKDIFLYHAQGQPIAYAIGSALGDGSAEATMCLAAGITRAVTE